MPFYDAICLATENDPWEGDWARGDESMHAERRARPVRWTVREDAESSVGRKARRSPTCRTTTAQSSAMAKAAADARRDALVQLVEAGAAGSQAAVAQLYVQTAGCLFGVALRITGRHDWAEEVLQEAFIGIASNLGRFDRTAGSPMTWFAAIVRNRALDWRRRPTVDEGCDDFELLLHAKADHVGGPEETLMAKQAKNSLEDCLRELPALQRQAIVLAYCHGLSHNEIAARLQFPLGTTKTWIRRGLQRLKQRMEETA